MIILGLTGGIGMGKSTIADVFAANGIPVWDADAAVHRLYQPSGLATAPILAAFGDVADEEGGIDRGKLSKIVVGHSSSMKELEAIVHPLVAKDRMAFLAKHQTYPAVLLDIPLLFEGGQKDSFDYVIVVSAPDNIRRARVLTRPEMTPDKLDAIIARQTPDEEKRRHADFVINTGGDKTISQTQVHGILRVLGLHNAT